MQIVFLGYSVPEEEGINNQAYSAAGNKFELGILDGISKNYLIHAISVPPVPPFPVDKRIFVRRKKLLLRNGMETVCVSFLNFPILKQIWQSHMVFREAKKLLKNIDDDVIIMTYNLYPQIGSAAVKLKKIYKKTIVSVIADLPFDDASKRNVVSKIIIELYNKITRRNLKLADWYILLNENSRVFIPKTAPFLVVEGGVKPEEWNYEEVSSTDRII